MIMQSISLLSENAQPTEKEIREGLEGNLCRCTGYQNIVAAVQMAADEMASPTAASVDRALATAGAAPADETGSLR